MDSPETWRWIWLAAAITFGVGEMLSAGTFFLAPFAIAALAAAVFAFLDVSIAVQWLVFAVTAILTFLALRPLARRLDRDYGGSDVGAARWSGRTATVLQEIGAGPDAIGLVRIDREEWRAQSRDAQAIPTGTTVRVVRAEGTRVVVERLADAVTDQESPAG